MTESLTYNTVLGALPPGRDRAAGADSVGPKVTGIYFSTSPDLIHWSPRRLLTAAADPARLSLRRTARRSPIPRWSTRQARLGTFATTGAHPYLYYTQFRYSDCRRTPTAT